jgi:hypothetical protein
MSGVALGLVVCVACGASNPTAAVKADLSKLQEDGANARATIVAEARKVPVDAASAKRSGQAAARAAVKRDVVQMRKDIAAARNVLKEDRAKLKADLAGAEGNGRLKELRSALTSTWAAVETDHAAIRSAVQAARKSAKDLRASLKKRGHR